jgi:PST family polysaccharide transporter
VSVASGIVMARLLSPRDFGVFAAALLASDLLMSLNDAGLIAALVRQQGDVRRAARTAQTLVMASSVLLYGVLFALAAPFAAAVHAPDATAAIRVLALTILIDGVSAVPAGLLTRSLRQDRRAVAELSGSAAGIGLSVGLALAGLGPWSLVLGRLGGNAVTAAAIVALAPFRPLPGLDRRVARELLSFSGPLAVASLLSFALLNVDTAIVGGLLGPVQLGLYVLAFNLSTWPVTLISQTARRVALAGFARVAVDPAALAPAFGRAFGLLVALTLPACLLLATLSEPLVTTLYGLRWRPAAGVLGFLAVLAAVRVVAYLAEDLLAAAGRSRSVLWLQAAWLAGLTGALLAAVPPRGIEGAGLAQAAVAAAMLPPLGLALRRAGVRLWPLLRHLPDPVLGAAVAAAVSLAVVVGLSGDSLRLLLGGAAGAAAYGSMLLASPGYVRSLLGHRGPLGTGGRTNA